MDHKSNMYLISRLIQNLNADLSDPRKPSTQGRMDDPFSEVFRGIEASREVAVPAPQSGIRGSVKAKRTRQGDEVQGHEVKQEKETTPPVREDTATPKMLSQKPEARAEDAVESESGDLKTAGSTPDTRNQGAAPEENTENFVTGSSAIKQNAAGKGAQSKVALAGDVLEADIVNVPVKEMPIATDELNLKSKPVDGQQDLEIDAKKLMEADAQSVDVQTKLDLKTALAKELLAKQHEIASRQSPQVTPEKPLALGIPTAAANPGTTTSIAGILQGASASEWMGAESGQQGDPGQGGRFSGNPASLHFSNLRLTEGAAEIEKTATDFRAMLETGRAVLDERAVLRQVAQQLRAWRPGQHEPIRFLLEPKNLGTIQIDVKMEESGVMAHMVTSDPKVKALLEGNQNFLQNALKAQGLEMNQFSVDLGDRKGFSNENRGAQIFKKAQPFSGEGDAIEGAQRMSSVLKHGSRGLSLYI